VQGRDTSTISRVLQFQDSRNARVAPMPNVRHGRMDSESLQNLLNKCADNGMVVDSAGIIVNYYKTVRRSRVDSTELDQMQPWIGIFLEASVVSLTHQLGC